MKKLIALILVVISVFAFTACGNEKEVEYEYLQEANLQNGELLGTRTLTNGHRYYPIRLYSSLEEAEANAQHRKDAILAKGIDKIEYIGQTNGEAVFSDWKATEEIEIDNGTKQFKGNYSQYTFVIFRVTIATEDYQYFAFS